MKKKLLGMARNQIYIASAFLAASCWTSHRSAGDPDSGDTEDSDTESVSETEDTGVVLGSPIQLVSSRSCEAVSAIFYDGRLVVSWTSRDLGSDGLSPKEEIAVIPWLEPDQILHADSTSQAAFPVRQIVPAIGQVLSLTYCYDFYEQEDRLSQTMWSFDANLVDGPNVHSGYDGYYFSVASGNEVADEDGRVVVATLSGGVDTVEPGDETILFAVDRFGPEGFRGTLFSEIYDWSEQSLGAGVSVGSPFMQWGGTFVSADLVVAFGVSTFGSVIYAAFDGETAEAPRIVANPPVEYQGLVTERQVKGARFAQKGDFVLGIVQLYGYFVVDHERQYSVLFDLDGNVVEGPTDIGILQGGAYGHADQVSNDLVVWGERFAYCYFDDVDGVNNLVILDQHGLPKGEPLRLAPDEAPTNSVYCAIEVVDEATLAVVFGINLAPYDEKNGPYLVVVTDPSLE